MKNPTSQTIWSRLRYKTCCDCPRHYALRYQPVRYFGNDSKCLDLAKRLKAIQTTKQYVGSLVHRTIRQIIQNAMNGKPGDPVQSIREATTAFNRALEYSERNPLERMAYGHVKFLHHQKGNSLTVLQKVNLESLICETVSNFYQMGYPPKLLSTYKILSEYLDPEWPIKTECLGFPAYIKTDVVCYNSNCLSAIDWKTGQMAGDDKSQAEIYCLFAKSLEKLPRNLEVSAELVYLANESVIKEAPRKAAIGEILWRIQEEYSDLLYNDARVTAANSPPYPGWQCQTCVYQFICIEGQNHIAKSGGAF